MAGPPGSSPAMIDAFSSAIASMEPRNPRCARSIEVMSATFGRLVGVAYELGGRTYRTRARSVPTTRLRTEPFEALETWLTFGVNLSAIKCFALVAVANNFVCGVEFSEVRCRLRIVLVGVRVQFFREAPISTLDIGLACTLGNPQDFVGVAHRIQTPVSPLAGEIPAA